MHNDELSCAYQYTHTLIAGFWCKFFIPEDKVNWHITSEYSKELATKSNKVRIITTYFNDVLCENNIGSTRGSVL